MHWYIFNANSRDFKIFPFKSFKNAWRSAKDFPELLHWRPSRRRLMLVGLVKLVTVWIFQKGGEKIIQLTRFPTRWLWELPIVWNCRPSEHSKKDFFLPKNEYEQSQSFINVLWRPLHLHVWISWSIYSQIIHTALQGYIFIETSSANLPIEQCQKKPNKFALTNHQFWIIMFLCLRLPKNQKRKRERNFCGKEIIILLTLFLKSSKCAFYSITISSKHFH